MALSDHYLFLVSDAYIKLGYVKLVLDFSRWVRIRPAWARIEKNTPLFLKKWGGGEWVEGWTSKARGNTHIFDCRLDKESVIILDLGKTDRE